MTSRKKPVFKNTISIKLNKQSKLEYLLDLDSLFGHMTFEQFKHSVTSNSVIKCELDNSEDRTLIKTNVIKGKYKLFDSEEVIKDIGKLPYVRIGSFQSTEIGQLDLYIILIEPFLAMNSLKLKSIIFQDIKCKFNHAYENIASINFAKIEKIDSIANSNKFKLSCDLPADDFLKIMKTIFTEVLIAQNPQFFFQTFGNKTKTINHDINFQNILNKISYTFTDFGQQFIYIDVCVSVSYGQNTVTLASKKFFDLMKLEPNYIPLFTNTILNFNNNTINSKTLKPIKTGIFENIYKINFYSTFTYHLNFEKSKAFVYPVTHSLILNNFYGQRLFSNETKFQNLINNFNSIEQKIKDGLMNGTCFYRCELRCKLTDGSMTVSNLMKYLEKTNFICFETDMFFNILQINIKKFTSYFDNLLNGEEKVTTDSYVYSIIAEYIFKTLYLRGCYNNTIFSKEIKELIIEKIGISDSALQTINNIHEVIQEVNNTLTIKNKLELLTNNFNYNMTSNDCRKKSLQKLISIFLLHKQEKFDLLRETVLLYLCDKTGDEHLNFSILQNELKSDTSINTLIAIRNNFIQQNLNTKSKPHRVLFKLYMDQYLELTSIEKNYISEEKNRLSKLSSFKNKNLDIILLNKVATMRMEIFFKTNNINLIFSNPIYGNLKRINLSFNTKLIKPKTCLKNISSEKDKILNDFKAKNSFTHSTFKVDENEIIRLLQAYCKYTLSSKRLYDIEFDFSYGFYPVRNYEWIKNKLQSLSKFMLKSQENFLQIIKKIRDWTPDEFTENDRITYLRTHNVQFNEEQQNIYNKLVKLDSESWKIDSFRDSLNNDNATTLFYKIAKNDKKYLDKRLLIEEYAKAEIIIPKLIIIEKPVVDMKLLEQNKDSILVDEDDTFYEFNYNQEDFNDDIGIEIAEDCIDFENQPVTDSFLQYKYKNIHINESFSKDNLQKIEDEIKIERKLNETFNNDMYNEIEMTNAYGCVMPEGNKIVVNNNCTSNRNFKLLEHKKIIPQEKIAKDENLVSDLASLECIKFSNDLNDINVENEQFLDLSNSLNITPLLTEQLSYINTNIDIDKKIQFEGNNDQYFEISDDHQLNSKNDDNINKILVTPLSLTETINKSKEHEETKKKVPLPIDINTIQLYKTKIFNKLRYKKFTINKIRKYILSSKQRLKLEDWSCIIKFLIDTNKLSQINKNYYKFNLKTKSEKYLNFNYIFERIIKESKLNNNKFKIGKIYRNITSKSRPNFNDWNLYIDDLVFDNKISLIGRENGQNIYSVN